MHNADDDNDDLFGEFDCNLDEPHHSPPEQAGTTQIQEAGSVKASDQKGELLASLGRLMCVVSHLGMCGLDHGPCQLASGLFQVHMRGF